MLHAIVQTVEDSIHGLDAAQRFLRQSRDPTAAGVFDATDDVVNRWSRMVRALVRDPDFDPDTEAAGRDSPAVPVLGSVDEERVARQLVVACASFVQARVTQIRGDLECRPLRAELDLRVEPAVARAEASVAELLDHAESSRWRNLLPANRNPIAAAPLPVPVEGAAKPAFTGSTLLVWLAGQDLLDWRTDAARSRQQGGNRWRGPLELRHLAAVLDRIRSAPPPAPRLFRVGFRTYREPVLPFSVVVDDLPWCTFALPPAEEAKQPRPAMVVNTSVLVASVDFAGFGGLKRTPRPADRQQAAIPAEHPHLPTCWASGPATEWNRAIDLIDAVPVRSRLTGLRALVAVGQKQPAQRQIVVDVLCEHLRGRGRRPDISESERVLVQQLLVRHLRPETRDRPAGEYWGGIDLNLDDACVHDLSLRGCQVRSARFRGARFSGRTEFSDARFCADAVFAGAVFAGTVRFDSATFATDAVFEDVRFLDSAAFDRTMFDGDARFDRSQFEGGVSFARARIAGDARFENTAVLAGLDEHDLHVVGTIRGRHRRGEGDASEPGQRSSIVA